MKTPDLSENPLTQRLCKPFLCKAIALLIGLLAGASLQAATLSYSIANPALGTNDISNFTGVGSDALNVSDGNIYSDGGGNDGFTYIAFDRAAQGQTFTTGSNPAGYQVKAVWLRHVGYSTNSNTTYYMVPAGSHFQIRVTDPSQAGAAGFVIATETAVTTGSEANTMPTGFSSSANGTGIWLRFQLDTPVNLNAGTTCGFDVSSPASFGGFGTQPFFETLGTSNDVYAGGAAYSSGSAGSGGDNTITTNVGDRVFAIEMVGQAVPPAIAALANQMVIKGNPATFTAVASGTLPLSYQWYFNTNTVLSGQTNPAINWATVDTSLAGHYSVVVTNDGGSRTSNPARLAVILPVVSTNFNFTAGGTGIQDANGIGTTFSTRLAGTGASIPASDPNLLIDTTAGTLDISSTTCDFNGQSSMDQAEAVGFNLSSIGFNGTQDFNIVCAFTNLPVGTYVDYDQVGAFVGAASTNLVRAGLIFNNNFANLSSYGVATPGGFDAGIATAAAPPARMIVVISRIGGTWNLNVNALPVNPNASLVFLNSYPDLTAGVFALDTSGTHNTTRLDNFSASLFTGPNLNVQHAGASLAFTWNVVGAGLESNTNLANLNGWKPVTAATSSPYVISTPASGNTFYRISQ